MTHHPRPRRRLPVVAAIALVAALSISCDSGPTAPDVLAHPDGASSGRIMIPGLPWRIAVSSNGTAWVTLLEKSEVARFDAAAPTTLGSSIPLAVHPVDVVFNRIGTIGLVAALDPDRWVVYSVDVGSGKSTFAREMRGKPYRILMSRDESRLLVLTYGDPSVVYSLPLNGAIGAKEALLLIPGLARSLAVSPTTGELFVTTNYRVARLDPATLETKAIVGPIGVGSEDVVISPDGTRLWFGSSEGNLVALDATSLTQVAEVANGANIYGLAMSPDGARLLATSLGDLLVVDPASASIVSRVTLGGTPGHIAFDRTGSSAFVANEAGWVDVIR